MIAEKGSATDGTPIVPSGSSRSAAVSEVKVSPDLKHAICFVEPLGGVEAEAVIDALNEASRFLRGRLGHAIAVRFTRAPTSGPADAW